MIRSDKFPLNRFDVPYPLAINGRTLPYSYKMEADSVTVRVKSNKKAYSHGFTISGDGYIDGKTIKLTLQIDGVDRDDCNAKLNEVYQQLYKRNYQLSNGNGYWVVSCMQKANTKYIKSYQFERCELTATLLLADPFRYGQERAFTTLLEPSAESVTFSIINHGSVDTPLTLTFVPQDGTTAKDINLKLGQREMHIQDTLLTAPTKLTVDTKRGTVRRDTFNAINTFSGNFLRLEVGENIFTYTGSPCFLRIIWRDRWLI